MSAIKAGMILTRCAVIGVEASDFEADISSALDLQILAEFEERDLDSGIPGGPYLPDECEVTVKLRGYESIPTSHQFIYRRAMSSDDEIEIQYRVKLIAYSPTSEVAVYSFTEVQP